MNLLVLPWPLRIDAKAFRPANGVAADSLYNEDRLFEYIRAPIDPTELRGMVERAVNKALAKVAKIDALILPELALTTAEWKVVEEIAVARELLLISGITDDTDRVTQHPVNSCRIRLGNVTEREETREAYRQAKHHRWCLDRSQVLQYDLGGQTEHKAVLGELAHRQARRVFRHHRRLAHVFGPNL